MDAALKVVTSAVVKVDDEILYRYSADTGLLEISVDEASLSNFERAFGTLPVYNVVFCDPFSVENVRFEFVRTLKSLPCTDGSYLMTAELSAKPPSSTKRGWLSKLLGH